MNKPIPLEETKLPEPLPLSATLREFSYEALETLAGLGYSPSEVAMLFEQNSPELLHEIEDPNSPENYHFRRGVLLAEVDELKALQDDAQKGNTFASARLAEIKRTRSFETTKIDIFGGFDDIKAFDKVADYISSGSSSELGNDEQLYLQVLLMIYNLDRQQGRRKTIAYFVNQHRFTHAKASQMHDEAMNLFYVDRNVEKKAMRNKEAETLLEMASLAQKTAKTAKDLESAANIRSKAHALMELNKPDPLILPSEAYLRPVRVFTLDVTLLGLPSVSRNELAAQIDGLQITEGEKRPLRRDAMIEEINFIEIMTDVQTEIED